MRMGAVRMSRGCGVLHFAISFLSALALPSVHAQTTVAGFTPGSFQVSESGAATYTIPIQVPPDIAGMEPKLALTYSSQGGNGLLGLGWSLGGLMTIHRCGRTIVQDGVNTAVSYNANDRYCLDGQRLVMISPPPAVYGTNGTEYRTERESFTKIVAFGAVGTGPAYFKAWTKSGQVMEFGNADVTPANNSRIAAQGKTDVRVYAVNKISDTKGNYLTFTYTQDTPNGDYTPSRIDYTGNGAASVVPFASVQFTYDTTRTDVSSSYIGGSIIKTLSRLTNVKTFVGATAARDYRLAYTYSPNGPSQVTSVTECTGDGTSCLPAHSFAWQAGTGSNNLADPVNWGAAPAGNYYLDLVFGDINGDGFADMVYASGSSLFVRFSNGSSFGEATVVGSADIACDGNDCWLSPIAVADVNGDGRADVISLSPPYIPFNVRLSTGTSLAAPVNWGSSPFFSPPIYSWWPPVVGDINGDGLADIVYPALVGGAPSIVVHFSNGSSFGGATVVGPADSDGKWGYTYLCAIAVADVNGDGRADVITVRDSMSSAGAGNVRLSTGTSLAAPVNWGSPLSFQIAFGDINGDGLADMVYVAQVDEDSFPSTFAYFSNGASFIGPVPMGSADWDSSYRFNPIAVADVNGDGRADVITLPSTSAMIVSDPGSGNVRVAQTRTPDLITAFTNSLGASTTIPTTPVPGYKPLTDSTVYTKDTGSAWPVRDLQAQGPMYVVASTSQTNGVGGSYVMNYKYTGAKVHLTGGGFLGFRMFEATDAQTLVKTATSFRQDYPFQGLPTAVVKTQSSGAVINQVTNGWTNNPAYNALPYTYTTGKYHRPDLTSMVESSNDVNGAAFPTVTTTIAYDAYGNAQNIAVSTGDGYSKSTANTYTNDTANWFLGRLTRSQVTSTTP